jgi:hypothetical protein
MYTLPRLLLICFMLTSIFSHAQVIPGSAKDAVALREHTIDNEGTWEFKRSTADKFVPILVRHVDATPPDSIIADLEDFAKLFEKNPFLKGRIRPDNANSTSKLSTAGAAQEGILQSAGNLSISSFADGLASFLVDRAKQELNTYFFQRFKDRLNASAELTVLFPNTNKVLQVIGVEIYHYNAYLEGLRAAFKKDLSNLFVTFPTLLDDPKYKAIFEKPEFKHLHLILNIGCYITNAVRQGEHPGKILKDFPQNVSGQELSDNAFNSIRVAKVISAALEDYDNDNRYWITANDAQRAVKDDKSIQLFLGLMYQSCPSDIVVKTTEGTFNFKTELGNSATVITDYQLYKAYVVKLSKEFSDAENELLSLKEKIASGDATAEDYSIFFNEILDMFDFVLTAQTLPKFPLTAPANLPTIIYSARLLSDIYVDISGKNYAGAITNTTLLIDTFFNDQVVAAASTQKIAAMQANVDKVKKTLADASMGKEKRNVRAQKGAAEDKLKAYEDQEKAGGFRHFFFKYGSFMAAMVNAETGGEVQAALEAAALPPGSAIIKRTTKANISLNGYVGGFVGKEGGNHSSFFGKGGEESLTVGVTAPVGLAFSTGLLKKNGNTCGSLSLFIPLIDVGAVAAFRVNNDSVAALPDFKLQNIIAPGAYVIWGIGRSPLSLSAGYQIGPALRSVDVDAVNVSPEMLGRLSVSLTVDIPLFNLYTKSNY